MAYIEQQILGSAAKDGRLQEHVRMVERKYNQEPGTFVNGLFWQTRVLSLMYLLILLPKELGQPERDHPMYQEIAEKWSVGRLRDLVTRRGYRETQGLEKNTSAVYTFISELRNALAHGNIKFHDDAIELFDRRNFELHFKALFSIEEAQAFLEIVGSTMANRIRQSNRNAL